MALACVCLTLSCGHEGPDADAGIRQSSSADSGYLLNWNVELAWVAPASLLAALTVGTTGVELIRLQAPDSTDPPVIEAVISPQASDCEQGGPEPIAITALDVDGNGTRDVVASDSACGNWLMVDSEGGFQARQWRTVFPVDIPAYRYLSIGPELGGTTLFYGDTFLLGAFTFASGAWSHAGEALVVGDELHHIVSNFVAGASYSPSRELAVVQRGEKLQRIGVEANGLLALTQEFVPILDSNYRQSFDGFDHLQGVVKNASCSVPTMLGIGLFTTRAGRVPRRLQKLSLDLEASTFIASDLSDAEVVSYGQVAIGGTVYLGILWRDAGQLRFSLAELKGCAELIFVSHVEEPVMLNAIPGSPQNRMEEMPIKEGIRILSRSNEADQSFEFVVYDGYVLHMFRVTDKPQWTIRYDRTRLHDERTDLVGNPT